MSWLLTFLVLACGGAAEPTPPLMGTGEVNGRVALVKTGEGVPNAVVALLQDGSVVEVAATDAGGGFAMSGVSQGSYTAQLTSLELTGLDLRYVSFEPLAQPVDVGGAPVDVLFAGNGLVAPHVVGDVRCNGLPAVRVGVRVVGGAFDMTVETNEQGRYSATNLTAGHYAIILDDASSACAFEPGYHVVELLPGQAANVDFTGSG